jgi:glycosyltransferase involved in cell wall biosynthesis
VSTEVEIVAWQPVLTDHQAFTLEQLARTSRGMTAFVARREDPIRTAQGWTASSIASLEIEVLPNRGWLRFVLRVLRERREAIHVFGSPFDRPKMMAALALAVARRCRVYLISEPYSPISAGYFGDRNSCMQWARARLRPLMYRLYGLGLRGRIEGIFAISQLAVRQYRALGITDDRLHPFGYFIPEVHDPGVRIVADANRPESSGLRVVYIGSFIARKGVDLLLAAARLLRGRGVAITVDLYGPDDSRKLPAASDAARFCGHIPFGRAQTIMRGYDVLVLPSRYDGWGVVVNEALLAGVPVVCSDRVGARVVIEKWGCGRLFPCEDVDALAKTLETIASDEQLRLDMRAASHRAAAFLAPVVAAQYMAAVFRSAGGRGGPRPINPWYD